MMNLQEANSSSVWCLVHGIARRVYYKWFQNLRSGSPLLKAGRWGFETTSKHPVYPV
mgnify:CR=1 FL=1